MWEHDEDVVDDMVVTWLRQPKPYGHQSKLEPQQLQARVTTPTTTMVSVVETTTKNSRESQALNTMLKKWTLSLIQPIKSVCKTKFALSYILYINLISS